MSYSSYANGYVSIGTGQSNGRSVHECLMDGRITVSGNDDKGRPFVRVVEVVDGEIMDASRRVAGKLVHRIAYGKFESKLTDGKREVVRFRKGTGKGRHGKAIRYETLFGESGTTHSWYKVGRLVRQKFIYLNGRLAYDFKHGVCVVKDDTGKVMLRLKGMLDGSAQWAGHSVFNREMKDWLLKSVPCEVERYGKVIYAGQYQNHQRVGKWVEDGKVVFYEHGVAIPKALYDTPADKLDPVKLLRIDNAQLRMAMLSRAGFNAARLAKCGRVVHREGKMRLYDVKGLDTRILKVVCPSTASEYHIRVPKDSTKCEAARQWTFHVGAGVTGNIKFEVET